MLNDFVSQFTPYSFPLYGWVRLPEVIITKEEKIAIGADLECSNFDFLRILTYKGFQKKVKTNNKENAIARIKKELDVLHRLGFVDYILLLWKLVKYADSQKIARGVGRGSAAGCYIFI